MAVDFTFRISDIAILISTLISPCVAIQVQQLLERRREIKQRRASIFRVLMATRASILSPEHIEALNAIPIDFHGKSKPMKEIIDSWKVYINHLSIHTSTKEESNVWTAERQKLYVKLLETMAKHLGYEFTTTELINETYRPSFYNNVEAEQDIIRQGLSKVFNGKQAFPVELKINRPEHPAKKNSFI